MSFDAVSSSGPRQSQRTDMNVDRVARASINVERNVTFYHWRASIRHGYDACSERTL